MEDNILFQIFIKLFMLSIPVGLIVIIFKIVWELEFKELFKKSKRN
jgi:hypothetical protein